MPDKDSSKSNTPLKGSGKIRWVFAGLLVVLICAIGYVLADYYRSPPADVARSFVGRQSCIECHQPQADLFHGSHHDLAMDLATNETVLADFDGTQIEHYGISSRVFRDGERFMVNTEGPDGQMNDFEVKYVFGVEPLQQYMVELERPADAKENEIGRLQVLRLSWDTNNKNWFYLSPPDVDEKLEPNDPLHWTGITQCWNSSCADCHSTNLKKNFQVATNSYHTTFSEIDVSCEACHGPGSQHVELANRNGIFWDREHGYGLAKLKTTSNLPQIETCAPCHSRRTRIADDHLPGCNFDDYFATQLIADQIYHADGQIRDEDYVYGSFIQSKMFHQGIKCTDCHDPHSTKLKYSGNQLCTSCHQHPAGKYDTTSHHRHQPGTAGSFCVDCHMPTTTYMSVDARRDHSLRVPRPDLSVSLNTPNACTGCHINSAKLSVNETRKPLTQYLDWIIARENDDQEVAAELKRVDQLMADAVKKWYPSDSSVPKTKYYEQMAIGSSARANSVPTLLKLARDRTAPAMMRASALFRLTVDPTDESLAVAADALNDLDPKVVSTALQRIDSEIARVAERMRYSTSQTLNDYRELVQLVASQLGHESRRVRIDAARIFVTLPAEARQRFSEPEQRRNFELALDEFKQSLVVNNERAMSHTMLAGLYEMMQQPDRAKDAYRTAISIEPDLAGPRSNLAALMDAEAESLQAQLRPQAGQSMTVGQHRQIMEKIQSTMKQVAELRKQEHRLLGIDVKRSQGLPNTHGLHYRYGMACYLQGDLDSAEKHLLIAHEQLPDEPAYLRGLAAYYQQMQQPAKAIRFINRLREIDPTNPGYKLMGEQIAEQLKQAKDNE